MAEAFHRDVRDLLRRVMSNCAPHLAGSPSQIWVASDVDLLVDKSFAPAYSYVAVCPGQRRERSPSPTTRPSARCSSSTHPSWRR